MAIISRDKLNLVKSLYYREGFSMQKIAESLGVNLNAVVYFMRHNNLKCRTSAETNRILFEKKTPSFKHRNIPGEEKKELAALIAMLYWGEGYKSLKATSVDFANSDPGMIKVFIFALRRLYILDETKLKAFIYCYSDQDIEELHIFWSHLINLSRSQFNKPYIRKDFRVDGRKMKYGLIHIRYSDKKLLIEIKNLIDYYRTKFQ